MQDRKSGSDLKQLAIIVLAIVIVLAIIPNTILLTYIDAGGSLSFIGIYFSWFYIFGNMYMITHGMGGIGIGFAGSLVDQFVYMGLCVVLVGYFIWLVAGINRETLVERATFSIRRHVVGVFLLGLVALGDCIFSLFFYNKPSINVHIPISISGYIVFGLATLLLTLHVSGEKRRGYLKKRDNN